MNMENPGFGTGERKEGKIDFATITLEGKVLEKSDGIDKKFVEKAVCLLKIISKISEKTGGGCGFMQFIKIDGDKDEHNYRVLIYSVSESLYSIIFTQTVFKETFIPDIDELKTISKVLYDSMGENSKNILFKLGENLGISCTWMFNNLGMYGEEAAKGATTTLNAMQILNSSWSVGKGKITITVYNPWENCMKDEKITCYYIKGLITGIAKTAFKKAGSIEEVNCDQKDGDIFKFIFYTE